MAASHSRLRRSEDRTDRILAAVAHPIVRILAHPPGRITGSRAGVNADWHAVFAAAAERRVAVEIDGDPARQDLDHALAADALAAGRLFAPDSDAHTTTHCPMPRRRALMGVLRVFVPNELNCWPLDRLVAWLANPSAERQP